MMQGQDEPEIAAEAKPIEVDVNDILDESEEHVYRDIDSLFDDDDLADDGDLDFEDDEPSF
jgi:hypothetical protein